MQFKLNIIWPSNMISICLLFDPNKIATNIRCTEDEVPFRLISTNSTRFLSLRSLCFLSFLLFQFLVASWTINDLFELMHYYCHTWAYIVVFTIGISLFNFINLFDKATSKCNQSSSFENVERSCIAHYILFYFFLLSKSNRINLTSTTHFGARSRSIRNSWRTVATNMWYR